MQYVLKRLSKLDTWRAKDEVAGLKKTGKIQNLASDPSLDLSAVHEASSEIVSVDGCLSISHPKEGKQEENQRLTFKLIRIG